MKTRQILCITLSFLAVIIGICPYVEAASTLQVIQTPHEISGTDSELGVAFRSSLLPGDHVIIDLYIGTKRIHEEVDYTRQTFSIRTSQGNKTPVALSVQDILAVQKLGASLFSPPPKIHTTGRHWEALGRLLNLISAASDGYVIDISSGPSRLSFTSICPQIGGPGEATYTLGIFGKTQHFEVTVGPVCYQNSARGRCGKGGGPDTGIGFVQAFTQECLNHDVCCEKTKGSPPFCGLDCLPAFRAAEAGFTSAPDCGNAGGNWSDSNGFTYALSDADGNGERPVVGFLNATSPFCSSVWPVAGTRNGPQFSFTATNPSGPSRFCAASYSVTGTFSPLPGTHPSRSNNGCNTAAGMWSNSAGGSGTLKVSATLFGGAGRVL